MIISKVISIPIGVEVSYRHWYLRELLANTVLHNAPQIEVIVWLVRDTGPSLPNWLQVEGLWRLRIGRKRQFIKLVKKKDNSP